MFCYFLMYYTLVIFISYAFIGCCFWVFCRINLKLKHLPNINLNDWISSVFKAIYELSHFHNYVLYTNVWKMLIFIKFWADLITNCHLNLHSVVQFSQTLFQNMHKTWKKKVTERRVAICSSSESKDKEGIKLNIGFKWRLSLIILYISWYCIFFLCHYFQICEASSPVCCFHGNTECSRPPLGLGSARWHHGVSLLVRRYRQIEYYLLKSSECANYQLHADYVMFFALFICKWIKWYGWKYTPIQIYTCAEMYFASICPVIEYFNVGLHYLVA